VGVLANVFEAAGLATVSLVSVWGQAQRVRAPRALYCEFPLGRPLGRPFDPELQHRVLAAAFELLRAPADRVPLLERFPEEITDEGDSPLVCAMPPRFDPAAHPAADEACGLVPAYHRARNQAEGRTSFGKVLTVEQVPDALEAFARVANGESWADVGPVADPVAAASDVRAFYEEAAWSLAGHVPGARQTEAWFFTQTEAAKVLLDAQAAMKAAGEPAFVCFLLLPLNRSQGNR
jgi:hypothetical protein